MDGESGEEVIALYDWFLLNSGWLTESAPSFGVFVTCLFLFPQLAVNAVNEDMLDMQTSDFATTTMLRVKVLLWGGICTTGWIGCNDYVQESIRAQQHLPAWINLDFGIA